MVSPVKEEESGSPANAGEIKITAGAVSPHRLDPGPDIPTEAEQIAAVSYVAANAKPKKWRASSYRYVAGSPGEKSGSYFALKDNELVVKTVHYQLASQHSVC